MKRSVLAAAGSLLAAAALLALAAPVRNSALAQPPAAAEGHFLEVGKTYTFGWPGKTTAEHCKVLKAPRGDWIKVSVPRGGQNSPLVAWINVSKYDAIIPE